MLDAPLIDRHRDRIAGTLECLDRVVITGTLPGACHAEGMTRLLYARGIRIFDYTKFAEPLRNNVRHNAQRIADEAGLEIQFIGKKNFRKEDRIAEILQSLGPRHRGLVHIFSAMETCPTYKPWHDKQTHKTYLRPDGGKCLHYYFYFVDEQLGLCYLRVPTWCPFRLQFYFNGHNWLSHQLRRKGIKHKLVDNAFVEIANWGRAQKLADGFDVRKLHRTLDRYAKQFCPVLKTFGVRHHWSLMQAEYALDIVFKKREYLEGMYEQLSRVAIHSVKSPQVATFLGRKLTGHYQGEVGNDYRTRVAGTCIRHHMGRDVAIKLYDKFGLILRIEVTVNNVSFFKHYRRVEHRDGRWSMKNASLKKSIYSLSTLTALCRASNHRYLSYLSEIEDPRPGVKQVKKMAEPLRRSARSYRGFNVLAEQDHQLLLTIARGEFHISGLTNKALRKILSNRSSGQMSRVLKRLRVHGLIKKIGRTYKYYLTKLGHTVIVAALKLRDLVVIPALAGAAR